MEKLLQEGAITIDNDIMGYELGLVDKDEPSKTCQIKVLYAPLSGPANKHLLFFTFL